MRLGFEVSTRCRFSRGWSAIIASLQFPQLVAILCRRQAFAQPEQFAEPKAHSRAALCSNAPELLVTVVLINLRSKPHPVRGTHPPYVIEDDQVRARLWERRTLAGRTA